MLQAQHANTPDVHYMYGAFLIFHDPDRAVAEYKKELEISPNHLPALISLALEYSKRSDFAAALPYAGRGVKTHPDSFAAHNVLGRVLTEGGSDLPHGIQELELAEKIAPDSPRNHIALATAYAKAGIREARDRP